MNFIFFAFLARAIFINGVIHTKVDAQHLPMNTKGAIRKWFATRVLLSDPNSDIVCSPLSASIPIMKLSFGATGYTQKQIITALGFEGKEDEKSKTDAYARIVSTLRGLVNMDLGVVSRIFLSDRVKFNRAYSRTLKNIFQSTMAYVKRSNATAAAININDWATGSTNNFIKEMVAPADLPTDDGMIIVTAVFFRGRWKKHFSPVSDVKFNSPRGPVRIPMMKTNSELLYGVHDELGASVIQMDFAETKGSFVLFIPLNTTGLPEMLKRLDKNPKLYQDALNNLQTKTLSLTLPRFETESKIDLVPYFKSINLTTAFDKSQASLEGIAVDYKSYVAKAIQKAYIQINPRRSSKTKPELKLTNDRRKKTIEEVVIADRPFFYMITSGGEQLLAGIYSAHAHRFALHN